MNEFTDLEIMILESVRNTDGIEAAEMLVTALWMVRAARDAYLAKLDHADHADHADGEEN